MESEERKRESSHVPIEDMEVFKIFESVADQVWELVSNFDTFAKETLGKQLVRSCDSINLNLVEGDGRYSDADAVHFFVIARGSARETRLSLRRASKRNLINPDKGKSLVDSVHSGTRLLNLLINYRRATKNRGVVREPRRSFTGDPFAEDVRCDSGRD